MKKQTSGETALFTAFDAIIAPVKSRIDAHEWLTKNGIPNKRVEAYHYSDLKKQFTKSLDYTQPKTTINLDDITEHPSIAAFKHLNAPYILFIDGKLRLDISDISAIKHQISLKSSADTAASDNNPINHLTQLMWREGIELNIEETLSHPIHLIFASSTSAINFSRHFINLAAKTHATIIESHISLNNNSSFNLHHFNTVLNNNSNLTHLSINTENSQSTNVCRTHGSYANNTTLNATTINIGGGWVRREGDLFCNGTGINQTINGATLAGENQHIDNSYIIHHIQPENTSYQHFKNIVDDKAHVIFQGKVIVSLDAQKTDGQQMAQSILLSDDAQISCKPELEIYADDVECAHGATIGALDDDMLFYLRARGIAKHKAEKLLIQAFISEISDKLPDALKTAVDTLTQKWLDKHLRDKA